MMQILLRRIYGIWGLLSFALPFLVMLPLFYVFSRHPRLHSYAAWLNKIWANVFFFLIGIPYKIEYRSKPLKNQTYVYCANHTSMMDIITMGLVAKGNHAFVGKDSLTKIPLFGSMFAKLHIPVNRNSKISSYKALLKSLEFVEQGKSIIIFPEGGIYNEDNQPRMNPFKDGPFRIAIEKQIPIIPVTIPFNWIILKDDNHFLPKWHLGKAIVHEEISTKDLTMNDLENLKAQTFQIIQQELIQYFPELYESNQPNLTPNRSIGTFGNPS